MRAIIIQARMGSTRLRGKILLDLAGHTVLWHVLRRCMLIDADMVVCAIPDTEENNGLIGEIESYELGVRIVRGSEDDVLSRYHVAARAVGASTIIRVTSDCPLIDPQICDKLVTLLEGGNLDYVSNIPRTWPQGLDCEVFTLDALERARKGATSKSDKEHVGPWMSRNTNTATISGPASNGRWVLDYPEDYHFLKALFEYLPPTFPSYEEIQNILDSHPEISLLNSLRRERNERNA